MADGGQFEMAGGGQFAWIFHLIKKLTPNVFDCILECLG